MPSIFHKPIIELAVELQARSKVKFDAQPNDLIRDALFVLCHDAVTVHRACGTLVDAGWPAPAAALLRTAVDLNISALAVVNSSTPPMAAFRYFYPGFRRHSRNQQLGPEVRRNMRKQIRRRLKILPPALRRDALRVIREKDRSYWFAPEFATPGAILELFSTPDISWVYSQLSGAAHGSFLGLRLFREAPDAISINPEQRGPRGLSVDFTSVRLLIELLDIRNATEGLQLGDQLADFRAKVRSAAIDALQIKV